MCRTNIRLLVNGGRDFGARRLYTLDEAGRADKARAEQQRKQAFEVLDRIHRLRGIAVVISGKARGADFLGEQWAHQNGVPVEQYPADWDRHGKRAGMLRNEQMIDDGKPDVVCSFPGGRGTKHLRDYARKHGVPVYTPLE